MIEPQISNATPVWNMETGAGAGKGVATLGEVLSAFNDPNFGQIAGRDSALTSAMRAAQTNGATLPELQEFDRAVHAVPGALQALERALERIAPHVLRE